MIPDFFKLHNHVKHYEWGSPEWIPRLVGQVNSEGRPWAEFWMGAHPGSPSLVFLDEKEIPLGELIAGNPRYYLGEQAAKQYNGLPFLFKLLAAEKTLSIQVHPNLSQAREGFERENRMGIAPDAPNRNYKDVNHKPEIICALPCEQGTPFTGMCGFREPDEIRRLLEEFLAPSAALQEGCAPLLRALDSDGSAAGRPAVLRNFLNALFNLSPAVREELTAHIRRGWPGSDTMLMELMLHFAELYPHDPALLSPLYLNVFNLQPGEAVYLGAGTPHAYIHGFGVELMANSDNVLRGGLSPKHIDVPELTRVLDFRPMKPEIIRPDFAPQSCFTYPAPCGEFSLSVIHGAGETAFSKCGPAICVLTAGELVMQGGKDKAVLTSGESVFIPAGGNEGKPLLLRGNYTLYVASLPQ
ncbi:MAG: mannose-6-phosphate isomerase, class I [Treponema sp.]|nr:mannose-6-phosphate isomerase, class I [Treponema sp.]